MIPPMIFRATGIIPRDSVESYFDQSMVWFDFWSTVACSCWQYLVEDDKCYFYFTKSVRQDALVSFVLHAQ